MKTNGKIPQTKRNSHEQSNGTDASVLVQNKLVNKIKKKPTLSQKQHKIGSSINQGLSGSFATQNRLKIYKTEYFTLKIFLFVSIIVCNFLTYYMVIESFRSYFDYEVTTTSRTIYETPTQFPKVTLCNQNMFQTEHAWDFVANIESSLNFFKYPYTLKNLSYTEKYTAKTKFYAIAQNTLLEDPYFTNASNLQRFAHKFEDLLINCYFKNTPCSYKDFTWHFDPFYGNCFVFNSDGIQKTSLPGWDNGLKLEFYVYFNEKLNRMNSIYGGVGALIRIENSSFFVDQGWEGIRLPGGFQSDITIDRKFKYTMPKPYSNCEVDIEKTSTFSHSSGGFNSDLFELIKNTRYAYSQKLCFGQCYQKQVIKECNCTDSSFLSLYKNVKSAKTNEEINCAFAVYKHFLSETMIQEHCIPLCLYAKKYLEFSVKLYR
jgi:hypothetical protein